MPSTSCCTGASRSAMSSPVDRRESVVALMEPGDLFGELGMLDNGPRSAMARALEPSSVLEVPFEPVRRLFEEDPRLLWNVTRLLATRLRVMDEVLADSVFLDVTGRTAKRLLELANGSDQFQLPVTQLGGTGRHGRSLAVKNASTRRSPASSSSAGSSNTNATTGSCSATGWSCVHADVKTNRSSCPCIQMIGSLRRNRRPPTPIPEFDTCSSR